MEAAPTQQTEYTPTQQTEEGGFAPADDEDVLDGIKLIYKIDEIDGPTEEEDTTQDDDSEATQSQKNQSQTIGRAVRYNTRSRKPTLIPQG